MSFVNITKLYEEFTSVTKTRRQTNAGATSAAQQSPSLLPPRSACNTCCHTAAAAETGDQMAQVDVRMDAQDTGGEDGTAAFTCQHPPPAAATVKTAVQKNAACQASLVLLDRKDLKRILKRAVVSSLFKLISRHESRVHARERWLMKRLKKSLGKFERTMTALVTKTVKEQLAVREQTTLQEPLPLSAALPAVSPNSSNRPRSTTQHNRQQQRRHQRRCQTVSLETATCVPMLDSETAAGAAAAAAAGGGGAGNKRRCPPDVVHRITVNTLISEQQNSNNAFDYPADYYDDADEANADGHGRACLIPRRVKSPASEYWRHSSSQSSTRTTFSVDSLSESACGSVDTEPVYSGFNIATTSTKAPFPRFPVPNANCNHGGSSTSRRQQLPACLRRPREYSQPPEPAPSSLIYGEIPPSEENSAGAPPCDSWREASSRPRKPGPQRQRQHQNRKEQHQQQQQQQQQQNQHQQQHQQQQHQHQYQTPNTKAASIYSPARPVATRIHRVKPGVCQCHAAAAAAGEGTPCQRQQQPRCKRCPSSKRRRCPKRQQRKGKKQKNCCEGRSAKSSRRQRCKPGEASLGDCQPPRIVLCPAKRGVETFSRIRLQTQPGRFITRQVLFFDGSYLYKPVQPKCY